MRILWIILFIAPNTWAISQNECNPIRAEYEARSQQIAAEVRGFFNQELLPLMAGESKNGVRKLQAACTNVAAKSHAFNSKVSNASFKNLGAAINDAKRIFENLIQRNSAALAKKANLINTANGLYHVNVSAGANPPQITVFYDLTKGDETLGLQVIQENIEPCDRGDGPASEVHYGSSYGFWAKDTFTKLNFDDPSRTEGDRSFVSLEDGVWTFKDGLFQLDSYAFVEAHLDANCDRLDYLDFATDFLRAKGPLLRVKIPQDSSP